MPFDSSEFEFNAPSKTSPKDLSPGRANLLMVRDHIAALKPSHFRMDEWRCGTAACIGGWAEFLILGSLNDMRVRISDVGALLGLSEDQSDELFHPPLRMDWRDITIPQAVAVLDHLLATGEVSWDVAT
jgi:hypothetical protein